MISIRPSQQKAKAANETEVKQLETKKSFILNSIGRIKEEKQAFLKENEISEDRIDSSISDAIFSLPKRIKEVVDKIKSSNLRPSLDHMYSLSSYLNSSAKVAFEHNTPE